MHSVLLAGGGVVRIRPLNISITHKLSSNDRSQFDAGQTCQTSPDAFVAWRRIVGTSQIAAEPREFDQVGGQRFRRSMAVDFVSDQRVQQVLLQFR